MTKGYAVYDRKIRAFITPTRPTRELAQRDWVRDCGHPSQVVKRVPA